MTANLRTATAPPFNHHIVRFGAVSALISGVAFFLTTIYILVIMPGTGWTFDMFDDPVLLFTWLVDNVLVHTGMWLLFFCTQAFLLPVPFAVHTRFRDQSGALPAFVSLGGVFGTVSVILTLIGPIALLITAPYLAQTYAETASADQQATTIILHNVVANLGMELRLFGEIFLGLWLCIASFALIRLLGAKWLGGCSLLIGLYTILVAIIKIIDNLSALEDSLGLFLAIAYVLLGVGLLRTNQTQEG